MLSVSGLTVRYGGVDAVVGLSLEVGPTDCVCLLGPNGAGKTSTLRAISGEVGYQGRISLDGADLGGQSAEARARAGVIQVPEGRRLFRSLSVHENLQVGGAARGKRPSLFSIDDVYDLFPALVRLRHRAAWALSGGEQQMVALGRGLLGGPRVLMLDEPSLGLSPRITEVVFDALAEIRRRVAVLLVEQNTALALESSDRGYVLASGRLVMDGEVAGLADRAKLLSSYLGQEHTAAEVELSDDLGAHGLGRGSPAG